MGSWDKDFLFLGKYSILCPFPSKNFIVKVLQFLALFVFLGFLFFVFSTEKQDDLVATTPSALPFGIGTADDPDARINYQIARLKDPMTGEIPKNVRQQEMKFVKNLPKKTYKTASEDWTSRGPFNAGGRTRAFAIDVNDSNTIVAGGVTSGIFKSTDSGTSFQRVTPATNLQSITAIAQDHREGKTDTWYYGTGEYYGVISAASFSNRTSGDGIYKSTDNGATWTALASTLTGTPTSYGDGVFDIVWRIVVDPTTSQDIVYAAVYNNIMRSVDGGATWDIVLGDGISKSDYTDLIMTPSGVLYATFSNGTNKGFYRSENGIDWTKISNGILLGNVNRTVLAFSPCNENEVYFLANTPSSGLNRHSIWHYTYVSGDGLAEGGIWDNRSQNLPNGECKFFYTFDFGKYDSQSSYDMHIAVKPDDCDVVLIGGTNVYRSDNGFTTPDYAWIGGYQCDSITPSNYVYTNHHPDQHFIYFDKTNPDFVYTANDGGLYRTDDIFQEKVDWTPLNNGYVTTQFYTIAIEPGETDSDIIVGGTQDNGTWFINSENPTDPWTWAYIGDGAYAAITEGHDAYYLSWQRGRIFKFLIDEEGNTTDFTRIDHAEPGSGNLFINPFLLDPLDPNTMYVPYNKEIWRNTKLDEIELVGNEYEPLPENWEKMSLGLASAVARVTSVAMNKPNPDILFYGTEAGKLYKILNPKSDDFERINITSDLFPNGYISSIALDEFNPNQIMVTFSNYNVRSIFYSNNLGETWTDVGGNLEGDNPNIQGTGPSIMWGTIHNTPENGQIFYVGTSVGLYSTTDIEATNIVWEQEGSTSIGNSIINMMQSRAYDDKLVVATHGNGIFSNGLPPMTGLSTPKPTTSLSFDKVQPNPFNDVTKIKFSIPQDAAIDLSIRDMQGRVVSSLIHDNLPQGKHMALWNGTNASGQRVASGVYVLVLSDGTSLLSRRIVLL